MPQINAYAAYTTDTPLAPHVIQRREPRADDVAINILYCGVCHSDLHFARNDWGLSRFPLVPGHEIVGRVTGVGKEVKNFRVGDLVGVGCMVDSCRHCQPCAQGLEQYCQQGFTLTYGSDDRQDGSMTQGGYSTAIVVSEHFVLRMPAGLDPAAAAPLLCAGITTWSPLKHYGVKAGHKIGVIGMGGLGHMAIKLARALGAEVTVFTRTADKTDEALQNGAAHVVVSSDAAQMAKAAGTFDYMLDTVPVQHDLNPYLALLKHDGIHILLGLLGSVEPPINTFNLVFQRRVLAGSLIGGIKETQELLDFCAEHGIVCDIEKIAMQDINTAFERMERGAVRYRFVIDMSTLGQ